MDKNVLKLYTTFDTHGRRIRLLLFKKRIISDDIILRVGRVLNDRLESDFRTELTPAMGTELSRNACRVTV